MTSPAVVTSGESNRASGGESPDRRSRWRQGIEKARERIRSTASGKGERANGLKDAARRISEAARERMKRGRETPEGPKPKSSPQPERRAESMARDRVAQVKQAVGAQVSRPR